jgi:hypothetical protein
VRKMPTYLRKMKSGVGSGIEEEISCHGVGASFTSMGRVIFRD